MVDNQLSTNTEMNVNDLPKEMASAPNHSPQSTPTMGKPKKKVLILIALAIGIGAIATAAYFIFTPSTNQLDEQNRRLEGFKRADISATEEKNLVEKRKKILDYATKNNISVSESEIEIRKQKLIKESGQDKINATLNAYGWSQEDWTEVVRWQLLREKILYFVQPARYGEVISIRWDIFTPTLNEQVAEERRPIAMQYLNLLKTRLQNKEIQKLYDVYSTFDISREPTFSGFENNYGMQYSGWDDTKKVFREFIVSPDTPTYNFIYSQKIPSVSEVNCSLGGCQLYNIVSGTNESQDSAEIVKILLEENLPF